MGYIGYRLQPTSYMSQFTSEVLQYNNPAPFSLIIDKYSMPTLHPTVYSIEFIPHHHHAYRDFCNYCRPADSSVISCFRFPSPYACQCLLLFSKSVR